MLRGPSGGGKTTLLNLLGTIDKPTTGILGTDNYYQRGRKLIDYA